MNLSIYLKNRIIEFLDNLSKKDIVSDYKGRNDEYNLIYFNKDYENEIKKCIEKNQIPYAKKLYKELLDSFKLNLTKDVSTRLINMLKKVTDVLKSHLKEYNQEKAFAEEFKIYKEIIKNKDYIPKEIDSKIKNMNFFTDEEDNIRDEGISNYYIEKTDNTQEKEMIPISTKKDYKYYQKPISKELTKKINDKKKQINRALINEDITKAKRLYFEFKEMFNKFPSELYDEKIYVYSDLLSLNLRIHQLENYLKKEKKIAEKNKELDQEEQERLFEREKTLKVKNLKLENKIKRIKDNITYNQEDFESNIKNIKTIKIKNKEKELREESNDILKKPIKLEHKKQEKEKKYLNLTKKEVINSFYKKGLKNLFRNNNEEAENYFEKILNINPYYKPAIIRLEQIRSKAKI